MICNILRSQVWCCVRGSLGFDFGITRSTTSKITSTVPAGQRGVLHRAPEQRQKPPTNSLSKLVNSNLPAEAKTAVVEACGSHRVSIPRNSSRLDFQPESIHAVFLPEHGFHARPWNSRPNVFLRVIDIFCE